MSGLENCPVSSTAPGTLLYTMYSLISIKVLKRYMWRDWESGRWEHLDGLEWVHGERKSGHQEPSFRINSSWKALPCTTLSMFAKYYLPHDMIKISHPRSKHRRDLGPCSCIWIGYSYFRKVTQITQRKKYRKEISWPGYDMPEWDWGGGSPSSWNRCESGSGSREDCGYVREVTQTWEGSLRRGFQETE